MKHNDPHRLARAFLLKDGQDIKHWRKQWWEYTGTHYREISEMAVMMKLTRYIKAWFNYLASANEHNDVSERITLQLINTTLLTLRSLADVAEHLEMPCWITPGHDVPGRQYVALQNGILALDMNDGKVEMLMHSRDWFSPVVLPYSYDAEAVCPNWSAFLTEIQENDQDRIHLLQEWFGYCLVPDTRQHRFIVMEGEGSNGKSVTCDVLTWMLGEQNVSNVPLELVGARFSLSRTLGKLANIATEVGEIDKVAEGYLKSFTAGDRMIFERKFQDPIEAYPTARLVLATNNRPRFADRSAGIWRRMLLIPFRVHIPLHRQDNELKYRIKENELPGILNWSLEGLRRLRANKQFTVPALCRQAVTDYQLESNPAKQFLLEFFEEGVAADLAKASVVYQRYQDFCATRGYKNLSDNIFGKEVKRMFRNVEKARLAHAGVRTYYYVGLRALATQEDVQVLHENLQEGKDIRDLPSAV